MAASISQLTWNTKLAGHELHAAGGETDVLIIASGENPQGLQQSADIISRRKVKLTDDDRRRLSSQGIAEECQGDDADIMKARYTLDKESTVVKVERDQVENCGKKLTKNYILKQIEVLMKCSNKARIYICYIGAGKKYTGDWCFQDGFITFDDIANLYLKHKEGAFKGQVLGLIIDCSYSGCWVKACMRFLEQHGVQPCGHSAKEKGFMMKVYASCQPTEVPATFAFSARCAKNDKNTSAISYLLGGLKGDEIYNDQHPCGIDFTEIRCKQKSIEEKCSIPPEHTWQKFDERKRVFEVTGRENNQPKWSYLLLVDDDQTIQLFKERTQGENAGIHEINYEDYGVVIRSGWGREPPKDVKDWIDRVYNGN